MRELIKLCTQLEPELRSTAASCIVRLQAVAESSPCPSPSNSRKASSHVEGEAPELASVSESGTLPHSA